MQFVGKSGYAHNYDFAIQQTRQMSHVNFDDIRQRKKEKNICLRSCGSFFWKELLKDFLEGFE